MGIVCLWLTLEETRKKSDDPKLTATSIVFSWPTKLMSDVHVLRVITAAMKTKPLLFVALDAVIWAPSGDQLSVRVKIEIEPDSFHIP